MTHFIRFSSNPITDYLTENYQKIRDEYIRRQQLVKNVNVLEIQTTANKVNAITIHEKKPLYEGVMYVSSVLLTSEVLSNPEKKGLNWGEDEDERWFMPDLAENMPTLDHWIQQHRPYIASIMFNVAQPGVKLNHHYGPDSNKDNFRIHLCLTADPGCYFDIENEQHIWEEGELFGFDDAFVYHGIKHDGTQPRIIIAIDIKKSVLQEYAIGWEEREFVPRHFRTPPLIGKKSPYYFKINLDYLQIKHLDNLLFCGRKRLAEYKNDITSVNLSYFNLDNLEIFKKMHKKRIFSIMPSRVRFGILKGGPGFLLPHTDHNARAILNYYISAGNDITRFHEFKEQPKETREVYPLDMVEEKDSFIANSGETFLLNSEKLHSVERMGGPERLFITYIWEHHSYEEILENIRTTNG